MTQPLHEETLVFGDGLVGVLSLPGAAAAQAAAGTAARQAGRPAARPALVVVNAGLVHRVGPQRLHVALLRRMAALGFVGLRFDFSGIGDSLPRADSLPYTQSTVLELRQALDAVAARTGCTRFVVLGLSSGALVSLAAAGADERIAGVCMLNPHGFGTSSVWGQHVDVLSAGRDYARNVWSLNSWRKLLTGRTNYRRLYGAVRARLAPRPPDPELDAVTAAARPLFAGVFARALPTLFVFSEKDASRDNVEQILGRGWQRRLGASVRVATIADANHTFASPRHVEQVVGAVEQWLLRAWPAPAATNQNETPAAPAGAAPGGPHGL